ncbi:CARDB domain-containing protein [Paenibacillus sp. FSL H7-0716]|uniref:CARDB domain-containing protein n=2 Tax=Paenibacillus odorifer TaxID=189426 RepID=A0AB36J2K7_9BACL|nr:CARDB domain-containing protein [Paenibacillus odorifer]OME07047.1 hypothetical protein BSK60_32000 [Paenibacillus odorifer]OME10119.1 hypothetical protein BSK47_31360 [Paenibacillus odorifer]
MKRKIMLIISCFFVMFGAVSSAASADPMVKKYVPLWNYDYEGTALNGYIPAIDKDVNGNVWKLTGWKSVFSFPNNKSSIINNYDVFNVKNSPGEDFDKENGFGLVYKSASSFGTLFDAINSNNLTVSTKQLKYYRDNFMLSADDAIFKEGHPFFYKLENYYPLIRTSGIVQRLGIKFVKTEKTSETERTAYYSVSPWPELNVVQGNNLTISFTASGYSERNIRVVAAPKGAFPDLSNVVSLTDGKLINTTEDTLSKTLNFEAKKILKVLGKDVDIIVEDGYGRTAIKSLTLADNTPMDYKPTELTLTEGGQLWAKVRYDGEDFITSDSVNVAGIPNTAEMKIGGAVTGEFTMYSNQTALPQTITNGTTLSFFLGKIDVGKKPGKYYIKAKATINNPNHQNRALESPAAAYLNNEISGEWLIEVAEPSTDLVAQSVTAAPSTLVVGDSSIISAKVKNIGDNGKSNVRIRFYDNGNQIHELRKDLLANQTATVGGFTWSGGEGVHNITVHVDPLNEVEDKDRSNNIASTGCTINGRSGSSDGNCSPKLEGNWKVTYSLITGYHTKTSYYTWKDINGKEYYSSYSYTDYSDPIWENRSVSYQEELKVTSTVTTKQGIATDLKKPKESDRESRGSWEIIPYASKSSKDPNRITRAGYGFEVKVNTDYSNDWETKVPTGLNNTAEPIGGSFKGPDAMYAMVYDTRGTLVKTIKMEKTSGNNNTATWELPIQSVKSDSGKVYNDRKFFTAVNSPNGSYTIKVYSSESGMTGLKVCFEKKVEIWGSMYDDVQNLKSN